MRNVQEKKQIQELLRFYQNDTVPENYPVPYENNKKMGHINYLSNYYNFAEMKKSGILMHREIDEDNFVDITGVITK